MPGYGAAANSCSPVTPLEWSVTSVWPYLVSTDLSLATHCRETNNMYSVLSKPREEMPFGLLPKFDSLQITNIRILAIWVTSSEINIFLDPSSSLQNTHPARRFCSTNAARWPASSLDSIHERRLIRCPSVRLYPRRSQVIFGVTASTVPRREAVTFSLMMLPRSRPVGHDGDRFVPKRQYEGAAPREPPPIVPRQLWLVWGRLGARGNHQTSSSSLAGYIDRGINPVLTFPWRVGDIISCSHVSRPPPRARARIGRRLAVAGAALRFASERLSSQALTKRRPHRPPRWFRRTIRTGRGRQPGPGAGRFRCEAPLAAVTKDGTEPARANRRAPRSPRRDGDARGEAVIQRKPSGRPPGCRLVRRCRCHSPLLRAPHVGSSNARVFLAAAASIVSLRCWWRETLSYGGTRTKGWWLINSAVVVVAISCRRSASVRRSSSVAHVRSSAPAQGTV